MTIKETIERLKGGRVVDNDTMRNVVGYLEELQVINRHAEAALEYLNTEDGREDAFKEMRRALGLVNRFVCADCGDRQEKHRPFAPCHECGGDIESKVVRELDRSE